jgi:hypothetical protein
MADFAYEATKTIDRLTRQHTERDARMRAVHLVRSGHSEMVFRGMFPSDWPKPVVANFIDVAARDTAEMVGVMPTLTAAGDSVLDESKRSRQDKLTRIINFHAYNSRLGTNLVPAADRMNTYGFVPFRVEANYEGGSPHIHVDDSMNTYYEKNRWGQVVLYARIFYQKTSELIALYPEHAAQLRKQTGYSNDSDELLQLVHYYDKDQVMLFVPKRDGLILTQYKNQISRIPVAIAELPTLDGKVRGSFDDVLWVFAAKAYLAMLSLEATQKAVQSPIALPNDIQEFALGPDAIIRSANPEKIRRVPMELPQSALIVNNTLDDELRVGARFPQARSGEMDASVVTGRGVQALMGGFDSRIKTAQSMLGDALSGVLSLALEMDEAIWSDVAKDVHASVNGSPYQLKYTPGKDIKGMYTVTHEYGVMAGLDPNRALVWGLQALSANLISRSFLRRNLPVNLNVSEEEKVIDVEKLRDAALMSIQSYSQTLPELAASGKDPTQVIKVLGDLIEARKKGIPIEVAIETAFKPEEPTVSPSQMPQDPMAAMSQDPMSGMQMAGGQPPAPLPQGGGAPPPPPQGMQQLLAGLTGGGEPTMAARTIRQTQIA